MGKLKGQSEYEKFLRGESLTAKQAIKAQCFSCNGEEEGSGEDCKGENCPLYGFFRKWVFKGRQKQSKSIIGAETHSLPLLKTLIIAILMTLFATSIWADTASYYTYDSCRKEGTSGVYTASGKRFNENDLTCAMRSRAWGSMFKVTNLANGKSVIVRLNDFGPNKKLWNKGRKIDLSKGAFQKIANLKDGIIKVRIEKL